MRTFVLGLVTMTCLACGAEDGGNPPDAAIDAPNALDTKALDADAAPSVTGTSIKQWAACDGVTDDAKAVAAAFAAAKNGAFTLLVDCPVKMHVGADIARNVFIEDGTTVVFTGAGKLIVDNVLQPAFVITNSSNITLTNWNVEYDGGIPVDLKSLGYTNDGVAVAPTGDAPVSSAFNDLRLTPWLTANRQIKFTQQTSHWLGPTQTSSMFFVIGDVANLNVTGMNVYVAPTAGGEKFVPEVFSFGAGWRSNQTVTSTTPITAQYLEIPHGLTFSNITFDGTYMGFCGTHRDGTFEHIISKRYGDLMDANGQNVGGVGKWFAPPHLFYFNYASTGDPALFNENIQIKDVVDQGIRVGTARDKGGSDTISGYALSLKIGGVNVSVDGYQSSRPDGFMDVLVSDGLTISNASGTYDSSFLNDIFPGWRFPGASYKNVTFDHVSITDIAATSTQMPIGNALQPTNANITMTDVTATVNAWSGTTLMSNVVGANHDVTIAYREKNAPAAGADAEKNTAALTLHATPSTLKAGTSSTLTWTSKNATSCTPSGSWSGAVANSGTQSVAFATAGNQSVTLTCKNANDSTTATVPIVVTP